VGPVRRHRWNKLGGDNTKASFSSLRAEVSATGETVPCAGSADMKIAKRLDTVMPKGADLPTPVPTGPADLEKNTGPRVAATTRGGSQREASGRFRLGQTGAWTTVWGNWGLLNRGVDPERSASARPARGASQHAKDFTIELLEKPEMATVASYVRSGGRKVSRKQGENQICARYLLARCSFRSSAP
jgi:hypothetical protein